MAEVEELQCKECRRNYPAGPIHVCEFCFAPLEPVYDYESIAKEVSREELARGPLSIWRYQDLLPVSKKSERVDIGAGFTPLLKAPRLGAELGIEDLYLKNDTANPTHSFKDRVVSVALTVAKQMGFETVACASTGNLANAVAAHAARAGLSSFVFIPSDLERGKVVASAVYGGTIVKVKGNYDEVNRLCAEVAQTKPWAFVNVNLRAYYSEGSKTLGYEIAEQLGWVVPADVVVPVASGSLLTKVRKAFLELERVGLIQDASCRIHAAQAAGCNPVYEAIRMGRDHVRPVKPDTIAKSLAIGNPADGDYAVNAVRESEASAAQASDQEIIEGIRLLAATEGIFTETAGGVTVASALKLAASGAFSGNGPVVLLITGMGLKTLEAIEGHELPAIEIPPRLDILEEELRLL